MGREPDLGYQWLPLALGRQESLSLRSILQVHLPDLSGCLFLLDSSLENSQETPLLAAALDVGAS